MSFGGLEEERRRTGYTSSSSPVLDLPDLSGAFLRRNQKCAVCHRTGHKQQDLVFLNRMSEENKTIIKLKGCHDFLYVLTQSTEDSC